MAKDKKRNTSNGYMRGTMRSAEDKIMANLRKLESTVKAVLMAHPSARDDDFILINRVYAHYKFDAGSTYFDELMTSHKKYNLPSFESITRARRKLQAEYPELRASQATQAIRKYEQESFRDYALGVD